MAQNKVTLEIMTPEKIFYSGEIEMVRVEEMFGKEGFMAGHSPAFKVLKKGEVLIKESGGQDYKTAEIPGGYIIVKDKITIYTPYASWQ